MTQSTETDFQITVAARVAPEDIRPKDMVAVLNQVLELPSFFWCCSSSLMPTDELIRLCFMPRDPGKPFKVCDVCLPFVYVKDIRDKLVVFDTRQHQLVRLDPKMARRVWKRMRKALKNASASKDTI